MLVSLYTSRMVLNMLGVEDYGTYNVVGGVVSLLGFFNGAMASATQRFLSFDLGRKDYEQLRKTFNATQVVHVCIAVLVLVLAETFGLWFVNNYLNIPEGRMEAARWVYHFSVLSFMVNIIQVPYNALIIAREQMSVYAYVSILEVALKLLVAFMPTWIAYDKLKLYAVLLFGVSVIVAAIYRLYTRRHFEETKYLLVKDSTLYKTLISYSGWNLFGGMAGVAKGQGVSIILNIFFGTVVNAAQGVANQVNGAINSFVTNFQMASNPQIIKSYAADDKAYMTNLVIRTSKFSFYLLFMLTLPVMLEIDYILKIWLKIVPDYTATFTILILINALIDTVSGPLVTSLHATGRIKTYQLTVAIMLILILPITYVLFKLNYPPQYTYFVSISISIFALSMRLFITKKQIPEFSISLFLREIIFRNIPILIISISIPLLLKINMDPCFLRLIIVSLMSVICSITTYYFWGLNNNEKKVFRNFIILYYKRFMTSKHTK